MREEKTLGDSNLNYVEGKAELMIRKEEDCLPSGDDVVTCKEESGRYEERGGNLPARTFFDLG